MTPEQFNERIREILEKHTRKIDAQLEAALRKVSDPPVLQRYTGNASREVATHLFDTCMRFDTPEPLEDAEGFRVRDIGEKAFEREMKIPWRRRG